MALVLFDLDGTLTRFDTFIPYCLLSLLYCPQRIFALKPLLKACVNFYRKRIERQDLKEAFLVAFLEGARRKEIKRLNRGFFRFILPWIIREEMIEKMRLHKQAGDQVYLVSASPDVYLDTLARQWRLDGVICTKLEWKNGLLTGKILGKNCKERKGDGSIFEIGNLILLPLLFILHQSSTSKLNLDKSGVSRAIKRVNEGLTNGDCLVIS